MAADSAGCPHRWFSGTATNIRMMSRTLTM
jgi:hypothetical protein